MEAIIGVLKEELSNSKRLLKNYGSELEKLPRGSLVKRKIHHQVFYYLAYRLGSKVNFEYLGKLNNNEIEEFKKKKQKRDQYKKLMKDVKNQIHFIERALGGKRKPAIRNSH